MMTKKKIMPLGLYKTEQYHGCICDKPHKREPDGSYKWVIDSECKYHQYAAMYSDDHRIPWNCPSYHDGCNCKPFLKWLREIIYSTPMPRKYAEVINQKFWELF